MCIDFFQHRTTTPSMTTTLTKIVNFAGKNGARSSLSWTAIKFIRMWIRNSQFNYLWCLWDSKSYPIALWTVWVISHPLSKLHKPFSFLFWRTQIERYSFHSGRFIYFHFENRKNLNFLAKWFEFDDEGVCTQIECVCVTT